MTKREAFLHSLLIAASVSVTSPWVVSRFAEFHFGAGTEVLLTGGAIVGAAFLISWAAELAQFDVSRSLAMAGLALIAVLPEYAVDIYLAWKAADNPSYIPLVSANMTGANRLLIGIGWSWTAILSWQALRSKGKLKGSDYEVPLDKDITIEGTFLVIATLYCFILPIKSCISLWDSIILAGIFCGYLYAASKAPHREPHAAGPIKLLVLLPIFWRRFVLFSMFAYAGFVIFISTKPFTEGLIEVGKTFGIDEFLLIQWIAPLASESPEMIVVSYFALRGLCSTAMTAIISSKINQWTLLIASLPMAYSMSDGSLSFILLEARPREEVLLTAAQSLFALAVIVNLKISLWEAFALFFLFATQLFIPSLEARYLFSAIYISLALIILVRQRKNAYDNSVLFLNMLFENRKK